ncbi:MAG: hypothetical protein R3F14_17670 [Polyangiaceae bacterium]
MSALHDVVVGDLRFRKRTRPPTRPSSASVPPRRPISAASSPSRPEKKALETVKNKPVPLA